MAYAAVCYSEQVLGKTIKEDYRVVEEKFRCSRTGRIEGYGPVVLPK